MRSCKNRLELGARSLVRSVCLLLCLVAWLPGAQAAGIEIRNPVLAANPEGYALTSDFALDFNAHLEEAVQGGVTLSFVMEFELLRPRWYWMNERILTKRRVWRLAYHALTRRYRLSSSPADGSDTADSAAGTLHQSFVSLSEALQVLSRVSRWQVIDVPLKPGETYLAGLRFSLDIRRLPRPFQLTALMGKDWNLDSGWKHWQFVAEAPAAVPIVPAAPKTVVPAAPPLPVGSETGEAQ
jgi:hypothetical protein